MDAKHDQPGTVPLFGHASLLLFVGVVLSLAAAQPARADVRESVKRALPTTVGVEWHGAAEKMPPAKPVAPATSFEKDQQQTTLKSLTRYTRLQSDQVHMASGTLVSADGLVVTMLGSHEDGTYSVTFADGKVLPAKLLVDDRRSGLQLLKVDAAGLPYLLLSDQSPQVGEEVTWTYCLDLKERAAARGIIAARGRELQGLGADLLQLDTGVAMMSGGAPLVDEQGKLLGIIAFSRVGEASRIGFAIPTTAVRALIEARRGDDPAVVKRGMLGIQLTPNEKDDGRVVAHPTTDSPAAAAGVREGDEILAIDGAKVESSKGLLSLLGARTAGQKVKVSVRRDGKEHELEVTLAPAPTAHPESPLTGTAARALAAKPGFTAIQPDAIYYVNGEGRVKVLQGEASKKSLETLRNFYEESRVAAQIAAAQRQAPNAPVLVPTLQVQRSDVEKKLDEIGRDMQSLRQQMEKLTEELQRLQQQLSGEKPKP
ncbi:MAG: PDZ domain-containing protein [Planctomycetia bacterium]|nr:PDZ domain-containing protein [Planctomycetia bacterium]